MSYTPSPSARHQAERLAAEARADRVNGSFKAPLEKAQHAYELYPNAAFLLEIARDYSLLSDWAHAKSYYERLLATHPSGPNRGAAKRGLAQAKEHLKSGGDALAVTPLGGSPAPAPLEATPLAPARLAAAPLSAAPLTSAPLAPSTPTEGADEVAPPPIVEAPAPQTAQATPAPPPADTTLAPAPAVEGPSEEIAKEAPHHPSHALGHTFIGVAAASAIEAGVGWVEFASLNSQIGSASGIPATTVKGWQGTARTWDAVAIATTIVAGLAGGAAALAW